MAAVKCPKPPLPSPPEHVLRKSTAEQMIHGEERIPKTRRAFIRANNEENDREELIVVPWKMCPTVGELLQSINKRIDWKCDELRRARNNRLLNMDDLCADVIEPDEQIVASACRKRQRERRRTQRSQSRNTRKRRSQRESRSRHRRHPRSPPTRSPTRSQTRSPPPRSPKPEGVPQVDVIRFPNIGMLLFCCFVVVEKFPNIGLILYLCKQAHPPPRWTPPP